MYQLVAAAGGVEELVGVEDATVDRGRVVGEIGYEGSGLEFCEFARGVFGGGCQPHAVRREGQRGYAAFVPLKQHTQNLYCISKLIYCNFLKKIGPLIVKNELDQK